MFRLRAGALLVLGSVASGGCNCGSDSTSTSPPSISSFTATPGALGIGGGAVTLGWSVTDASTVSIDQGVGMVSPTSSGSTSAAVTASTTFTLSATNSSGTVTKTAAVCVARPSVLAATGPTSYPCHTDFHATFAVTNNGCTPMTVTAVEIGEGTILSGDCGPSSAASYPPTLATVPAGQTATVLDLTTNPYCCGSPGCPATLQCQEQYQYTAVTSAGDLTTQSTVSIDLGGCSEVCPP
jgi:hypothetical protein